MTTTLANLLLGVDMEGGENFCDSVYNFLKNQGKDINLFTNSGFGVWSQSDTNKGLATITYDAGSAGGGSVPSVGDAVVGGTSGAVCKVISYTIASGAFATNNATGVVTVGAVSSDFAFVDNETITFDGAETAVINMPDAAVQVGLVQNGGFATDTDPPPGWTAGVGATLTTEGAGEVGNCLMVLCDGTPNRYGYQQITTEVGKIYKCSVYFKTGTSASGFINLGQAAGDADYFSKSVSDAAWTAHTFTFEAATTTTFISLYSADANQTSYFDEVTCYEITPCCTAADALAFDTWKKDSNMDIYRQHNDGGTLTKDGSYYSLKMVPGGASAATDFPINAIRQLDEWEQQFAGRPMTVGMWVKTSTASHARIRWNDAATTYSSYHTGGGDWEWLEMSKVINATPTIFQLGLICDAAPAVNGDTIVYVSQPMLIFGWSLGEGMYQPRLQEMIYLEAEILSNVLNNLNNQSDIAAITMNLEADSDAKLPKGAKAFYARSRARDSGSAAGGDIALLLRVDGTAGWGWALDLSGIVNNIYRRAIGLQACTPAGDYQYYLNASGASTFDISEFRYYGVQVN